jgi:two-component sensor histidine kinase
VDDKMSTPQRYPDNKLLNALQVKYILPFLLIIGLMFSLFVWYNLSEQRRFLNEELEAKGYVLSAYMSGLVKLDLLLEDTAALNIRIENLKKIERDFESCAFYNVEKQIIASSGVVKSLPDTLESITPVSFDSSEEMVSIFTPLYDNTDTKMGHFTLALSKERGQQLIWDSLFKLLVITFLLLIVVAVMMAFMARQINYLTLDFIRVRERSAEELKKSYEELEEQNKFISEQNKLKETLLKEIHHRVKNNMQIIISLLRLQSRGFADNQLVKEFEEAQNRIISMALIHEKMYLSHDLAKVDLPDYIGALVGDLIRSYSENNGEIKADVNVEVKSLRLKTLVPVGLIINEVVSNAIKHAFNGSKERVIKLWLTAEGERLTMTIGDNGVGMSGKEGSNKGLGLELIDTFVSQIDGEVEILDSPGTLYKIDFEDSDLEEHLPQSLRS